MPRDDESLGIYVHIPFCQEKCQYCDFLSFGGQNRKVQQDYVQALLREIHSYGSQGTFTLKGTEQDFSKRRIDSIFFGGGTPSLLPESMIQEILEALRKDFMLAPDAEITIEANPGTISKEKLLTYRQAGINRLSIGVQSAEEDLLRRLGRIHSWQDFLDCYRWAREAGFTNINCDLMFALPDQSEAQWQHTLEAVLSLDPTPEHISFYSLQLEEGTEFHRLHQEGKLHLTDEETDRRMYWSAAEQLANHGYEHYEISNAARPGYASRHNLRYWTFGDYLGIGLGAHSFMNGVRFSNTTIIEEYVNNESQVVWQQENSSQDDREEYLFTGLRLHHGISLEDFQERFGAAVLEEYERIFHQLKNRGLLEWSGDGKRVRLTKTGVDVSNQVFVELLR